MPVGAEVASLRTAKSQTFIAEQGYRTVISAATGELPGQRRAVAADRHVVGRGRRCRFLRGRRRRLDTPQSSPQASRQASSRSATPRTRCLIRYRVALSAPGSVSGSTITYRNALAGTDVSYTAGPSGVKETITLASRVAAVGLAGRAAHNISGADPHRYGRQRGADGRCQEQQRSGFSSASAVDANGVEAAAGQAKLSIGELTPGRRLVGVALDRAWLTAPSRVYPVTVDPSTLIGGADDCYLQSGSTADTNLCTNPVADLGLKSGVYTGRYLFDFDFSSIPAGAMIKHGRRTILCREHLPGPADQQRNHRSTRRHPNTRLISRNLELLRRL